MYTFSRSCASFRTLFCLLAYAAARYLAARAPSLVFTPAQLLARSLTPVLARSRRAHSHALCAFLARPYARPLALRSLVLPHLHARSLARSIAHPHALLPFARSATCTRTTLPRAHSHALPHSRSPSLTRFGPLTPPLFLTHSRTLSLPLRSPPLSPSRPLPPTLLTPKLPRSPTRSRSLAWLTLSLTFSHSPPRSLVSLFGHVLTGASRFTLRNMDERVRMDSFQVV